MSYYERNDELPAAFWRLLAVCGLGLWLSLSALGLVFLAHCAYLAFLQF